MMPQLINYLFKKRVAFSTVRLSPSVWNSWCVNLTLISHFSSCYYPLPFTYRRHGTTAPLLHLHLSLSIAIVPPLFYSRVIITSFVDPLHLFSSPILSPSPSPPLPPRPPLPLLYHISIYAPSDYRRPSSLTSPSPSFRLPPPWVVRLAPCYQLKRRGTQI